MRGAWRVAEVRAAEERLMATVPAGALMQRAATGLARRCAELLADRHGGVYGRSVLLLVGAGNNGGDALYAGARLARRGAAVRALLLAPRRAHPGGLADLLASGGRTVERYDGVTDLVVDGVLGIGGQGGLRPDAASAFERARAGTAGDGARPVVVAVDVPSGIDVDSGNVEGDTVEADVTVTFGCLKPGLVVGPAAPRAGLVELVDIGLRPWLPEVPALRLPDAPDVAGWWRRPAPDDNKYSRGVVGVATGSATYPGAAVLSVAGALAGPVGMVRYAGSAADQVRARHPQVVAADRVGDAGRVQAWVCGSGLGTDDRAGQELRAVLSAPVPACLDADALTLLGEEPQREQVRRRHAPTVITPHDGEFARLSGEPPGADRCGSARALAAHLGVVVLLKGDRTVVATPEGDTYVNPTGTPALATAGSGDVLAGLLGALLAAGLPAAPAAVAAAYVHGLAGRAAAVSGPVTAVQVADALSGVLSNLLG